MTKKTKILENPFGMTPENFKEFDVTIGMTIKKDGAIIGQFEGIPFQKFVEALQESMKEVAQLKKENKGKKVIKPTFNRGGGPLLG